MSMGLRGLHSSVGIVSLIAVLVQLWSSPAQACSREALTGISGFQILPADGASAPQNARIWVASSIASSSSDLAVEHGQNLIPTAVKEISLGGEVGATLWVLEPIDILPAGVSLDVTSGGQLLSQFVVSDGQDITAPGQPVITRVNVASGYFGAWSCGEPSAVAVSVERTEDILLLTHARDPGTSLPQLALAVGTSDEVTAVDIPSGEQRLQLVAVDLAGNISPPKPLPPVTVPPEVSGCHVAPVGGRGRLGLWPLIACLFLLRCRSRQRCGA